MEQRLEELSQQSSALREHLQAERENLWSKVCIQEANYLKICNLESILVTGSLTQILRFLNLIFDSAEVFRLLKKRTK